MGREVRGGRATYRGGGGVRGSRRAARDPAVCGAAHPSRRGLRGRNGTGTLFEGVRRWSEVKASYPRHPHLPDDVVRGDRPRARPHHDERRAHAAHRGHLRLAPGEGRELPRARRAVAFRGHSPARGRAAAPCAAARSSSPASRRRRGASTTCSPEQEGIKRGCRTRVIHVCSSSSFTAISFRKFAAKS